MITTLEQRARQYRSRMLIRTWEYRQRHLARGVWLRLRRLLASASHAYVISRDDADQLRAEGCRVELVGAELEPAKTIIMATAQRARALSSAKEVPVSLSGTLLVADSLVLVPFDGHR